MTTEEIWRPNAVARLAGWTVVAIGVPFTIGVWVWALWRLINGRPEDLLVGLAILLIAGLPALLSWRLALHPYIKLTPSGVEVRNPLRYRMLPWSDIARAGNGYYGVRISTSRDEAITAWAVQKSNAAAWLRKRTRSDELVNEINLRARGKIGS
jgi:hypothetical protein